MQLMTLPGSYPWGKEWSKFHLLRTHSFSKQSKTSYLGWRRDWGMRRFRSSSSWSRSKTTEQMKPCCRRRQEGWPNLRKVQFWRQKSKYRLTPNFLSQMWYPNHLTRKALNTSMSVPKWKHSVVLRHLHLHQPWEQCLGTFKEPIQTMGRMKKKSQPTQKHRSQNVD